MKKYLISLLFICLVMLTFISYVNHSLLSIHVNYTCMLTIVATLALSSRPKQGLARLQAKKEARESHLMLLVVQKSVREWTFTLPGELPFWALESPWIFESLKGNHKGQNRLDWKIIYIIGNLLKLKCLKWAHMTHLEI